MREQREVRAEASSDRNFGGRTRGEVAASLSSLPLYLPAGSCLNTSS